MCNALARILLFLAVASSAVATGGAPDPFFKKVPFEQWISSRQYFHIRWSTHVGRPRLSVHQRLFEQIEIKVDGRDIAARRGKGSLAFFFQLTAANGGVFQDHLEYPLEPVEIGIRASDMTCVESLFVLPGDYAIVFAIFDNATGEHAVKQARLHVDPLKSDPLPGSWRDLPAVEFRADNEPPDLWFCPGLKGELNLPLNSPKPLQLDVILNVTSAEIQNLYFGNQTQLMSFLMPTLKVIGRIGAPDSLREFHLFDLSRQRVAFRRRTYGAVDWPAMKKALSNTSQQIIDVKSLKTRGEEARFFVREVSRVVSLSPGAGTHAIVILSGVMDFDAPQQIDEFATVVPPDTRIFYVRYVPDRTLAARAYEFEARTRILQRPATTFEDHLFPLLEPMRPQLFDVSSSQEMRTALAAIVAEISRP